MIRDETRWLGVTKDETGAHTETCEAGTQAEVGTAQTAEGAMELQQFQSSRRVRAKYTKALVQLSEQLNETWERVFPPEARFPRETCRGFFEPFAQFGVALYDAYAEELLDSNPSQEQYLQALNFDLKTLVCNQIYPYRENSIRTLQDAMDADARGELPGEWTVRMGETWRLFEHPRHSVSHDQVCRELIDVYGYEPALWGSLIDRIHQAISRRAIHWLSAHAEREAWARTAAGGFPKPNEAGTTGPSEDKPNGTNAGPAVSTTANGGAVRRAVLDPILQQKGYSRSKWATVAGVDPSVVYGYLKGTSNPNPESRKALAEAIGLSVDALPK
jgi:hypothetical protein